MVRENFVAPVGEVFRVCVHSLKEMGFNLVLADMHIGLIKATPGNNTPFKHRQLKVTVTTNDFKNYDVGITCSSTLALGIPAFYKAFREEEIQIMSKIKQGIKRYQV